MHRYCYDKEDEDEDEENKQQQQQGKPENIIFLDPSVAHDEQQLPFIINLMIPTITITIVTTSTTTKTSIT